MRLSGHIQITLQSGEALAHVPCHLDWLIGACRYSSRLDGGPLDRLLRHYGGGFRALAVYQARGSLGRAGHQHLGFNETEENLGMSRTYRIELADKERGPDVVKALRDLEKIESAVVQGLAVTEPFKSGSDHSANNAQTFVHEEIYEPFERIRGPQALKIEHGNEAVTVGVVDTGIALGHPEMQRKMLAGYDTVNLGMGKVDTELTLVGDSRGNDFNPTDEVGHGSHVAGIIGAQGWQIAPGIGGRCLILPIRVLAAARNPQRRKPVGIGGLSDINAGLKCCVDLGAKIINMSFGTPASSINADDPLPHSKVIRYADRYGCILIAAAGNSGLEEKYFPAALPEVIAVGSVDRQNRRSEFSTFGEHIFIAAPGERIISIGRQGYMASSGTSHAAPFVAGVAALLVSRAGRYGKTLNCADVKRILRAGAVPLDGGFNRETGHGLLDAVASLNLLEREPNPNRPP